MTNIIKDIKWQLERNPHVNRIIVSKVEWLLIKREINKMCTVKRNKRPIGNPKKNPWLIGDQLLWDAAFKAWRDYTPVYVMGIRVEYR